MIERLAAKPFYTTGSRVLLIFFGFGILWRIAVVAPGVGLLYIDLAEVSMSLQSVRLLHLVWAVAALGLITTRFTREAALVCAIAYSMDAQAGLQNAGSYVARIVLVYAVFLDGRALRGVPTSGLRTFLHNLAVGAIIAQLCVMYLNTFIWKLMGPDNLWLAGTSLYYITHTGIYTSVWSRLFEVPSLTYLATYSTLIYQLSFVPLLFSRWHWFSVLVGLGFHLAIGVVMGLVSFGLIMIGLVLFTVKDETWLKLRRIVSTYERKLKRRSSPSLGSRS